jgi:hypothetical protein
MTRVVAMATFAFLAAGDLPAQAPFSAGTNRLPRLVACEGAYTHPGMKMVFPENVGQFLRSEIMQYDARQRDVGIGYTCTNAHSRLVAMTVYVYPAPAYDTGKGATVNVPDAQALMFRAHMDDAAKAILDRHKDARVVTNEVFVLTQGAEKHAGQRLTCELKFAFGPARADAISQLYLFQHRNWLVKYRVTYPKAARAAAEADIGDFLQQLTWPK